MYTPVICEQCGENYTSYPAKKYCSDECYRLSKKGRPISIPPERRGVGGGSKKGSKKSASHVRAIAEGMQRSLSSKTKTCIHCATVFPLGRHGQLYCSGSCWSAARRQRLKKPQGRFVIARADFATLLQRQDGVCAICGGEPGRGRLAVDHCHESERVRGLLCGNCNRALGLFKDDVARIRRAADYLESADTGIRGVPASRHRKFIGEY